MKTANPKQGVPAYRQNWLAGVGVSVALHAVFFAVGGWALVKPITYGVEAGRGGIEVNLLAAPAEIIPENAPQPEAPQLVEPEPVVSDPDPIPLFQQEVEEKELPEPRPAKADLIVRKDSAVHGDGSAATSGLSATTFHASAGAVSEAKPDYLKNPAPAYPWIARRNGWEGVVTLRVSVAADGRPAEVTVERSSGHAVLDETAVKTVKTWRFRPAMLGALPIESSVRFPVRFELDSIQS